MKKTIFNFLVFTSILLLMLLTACNDPAAIGAEVIDPDRPDVEFTDTITLRATSIEGDSVQTYNFAELQSRHLFGLLEDPIFGTSSSVINTQLSLLGRIDSTVFENVASGDAVLDSVVFVIEMDTANFFGVLDQEVDISISLLNESLMRSEDYYSSDVFQAGDQLTLETINPSNFNIDSTYSITITQNPDSFFFPPLLRIRLDEQHPIFQNVLFGTNSNTYYENDDNLLNVLSGVQIKMEETSPSKKAMMAFDLISPRTGMYLYYRAPSTSSGIDTTSYRFVIDNNTAHMTTFDHDFSTGIVKDSIGNTSAGDNLVYLQGMSGLNAKLDIPYAQDLQNTIVNKAQLEFTVATILSDDLSVFYEDPVTQLLISSKNDEGELNVIQDIETALLFIGDLEGAFGGDLFEEISNNVVLRKYKMNISEHLQNIIDGSEPNTEIFITAQSKAQNAQRVILFGPKHSTYPMKLNLTYTINQ